MIDIVIIGLKEGKSSERLIGSIKKTADIPYRIIKSFRGSIAENLNKGFKQVESDVFGFFQDDWEFIEVGWMSTLVRALEKSDAGYVAAKQLYPSGKMHCAWLEYSFPDGRYYVRLRGNEEYPHGAYNRNLNKHGVPVFIKSKRFREIGGHDEGYKASQHEEPDLCLRLGKPLYVGSVDYIHHFRENPKTENMRTKHADDNLKRLEYKFKQGDFEEGLKY